MQCNENIAVMKEIIIRVREIKMWIRNWIAIINWRNKVRNENLFQRMNQIT